MVSRALAAARPAVVVAAARHAHRQPHRKRPQLHAHAARQRALPQHRPGSDREQLDRNAQPPGHYVMAQLMLDCNYQNHRHQGEPRQGREFHFTFSAFWV